MIMQFRFDLSKDNVIEAMTVGTNLDYILKEIFQKRIRAFLDKKHYPSKLSYKNINIRGYNRYSGEHIATFGVTADVDFSICIHERKRYEIVQRKYVRKPFQNGYTR